MDKIRGSIVLMKKNILDLNDLKALVSFRLICVRNTNSTVNELRSRVEEATYPENSISTTAPLVADDEVAYEVTFDWENDGIPGAVLVENLHDKEFYLKTFTLEDVPDLGRIHFICNSWVYPAHKYQKDRIFFTNQTYLPSETPEPLRRYREEELAVLRGDGTGELKEEDRVYDYAFYNDLGDPDKSVNDARPTLGGSSRYPYPRRGRTSRQPNKTDPETESRLPLLESLSIYVPRDERFRPLKMSDFLAFGVKSIAQFLLPEVKALWDGSFDEFDSFEAVFKLYEGGIKLPEGLLKAIREKVTNEIIQELLRTDGAGLAKYPLPDVIKEDKSAWETDDEFAREMLAGVNPVVIRLLNEFPPKSKLDSEVYGNQDSSITREDIENQLEGLKVEEAIENKKLFILDHHDTVMPYLRRINTGTASKVYATRTLLFLRKDGTLKPLAIELSLPHPEGDHLGAISKVYTPAVSGVEGSLWQLAKAFVAVNDSGIHQLISHWLNTHAVIEPFVIATNRQLSVLHPVYKLLQPHFRDTMNINAFGRIIVINSGGAIEETVFPGKYAMEMSSAIYKDWVFPEQALPADLIKRGMAIEDSNSLHGLRLVIEDYPYAVDGLEIWSAIKTWVGDYCEIYYKNDDMVQTDTELQSWWKELREEGHGDKRDEPWWPRMETRRELIDTCTTIIWVASALHAALNFGQFPYAGFMPNRPTLSRRFMPEPNTPEYEELKKDPKKALLKTITAKKQTLIGISLIEILSRHSSDEVYLGQRDTPEWTKDVEALEAFERFTKKIKEIEAKIVEMNGDDKWKNRLGPVKVPYMSLYPTSEQGITGKGIPNSVSI